MSKRVNYGELSLMPYTIQDGFPSMGDSYIMSLYDEMERNHQLRWVFFSGGVSNREEWLAFIKSRINPFWVMVDWSNIRPDDYPKAYGHILLTDCKKKYANVHFCFFRCNDKLKYASIFTKEMMRIMDFETLIGLTPVTNIKINQFMEQVPGFKKLGVVPKSSWDETEKKTVDSVIYYFEAS